MVLVKLTYFWLHFVCVYFGQTFLSQHLVLRNLTRSFFIKTCCSFSYKDLYWNVRIIGSFGPWSLVYSSNIQKNQISVTGQRISGNNNPLLSSSSFLSRIFQEKERIIFSHLKFCYHRLANRKKLILLQVKYLKILKEIPIGTIRTYSLSYIFTIFQNRGGNAMGEIWVVGAMFFLFVKIAKKTKIIIRLGFTIFCMENTDFRGVKS